VKFEVKSRQIQLTWATAPLWWKLLAIVSTCALLLSEAAGFPTAVQTACFGLFFCVALVGAVIGLRQNGNPLMKPQGKR
jgi:hypothetical protein